MLIFKKPNRVKKEVEEKIKRLNKKSYEGEGDFCVLVKSDFMAKKSKQEK